MQGCRHFHWLLLVVVAWIRIDSVHGASNDGWTSHKLTIQLRKEGAQTKCSDEALHQLETEMNEWFHDEISLIVGAKTSFRLAGFRTTDGIDRADLQSQLECTNCNTEKLSRLLQRPAQGLIDLWIHQNDSLAKGCVGDDTAVAVRLDLLTVSTS
jgi:hypothetical protein